MKSNLQFKAKNPSFFAGAALLVASFGFSLAPNVFGVSPPPDGGYPGGNTAEGSSALFSLTSGQYNTAVGVSSLYLNTNGSYNTALGAGALSLNTGDNNTAAGTVALFLNRAPRNTAFGSFAVLITAPALKIRQWGIQRYVTTRPLDLTAAEPTRVSALFHFSLTSTAAPIPPLDMQQCITTLDARTSLWALLLASISPQAMEIST